MREWLEGIAGPAYATAMLWTLAALLGLLVLLVLIKVIRSLTFGTFVSGGRSRKTRLAVMDAAAVDSQRRLVLVRRDDVEHLILIGGPTDVVVEQNIRLLAPARRPAEDATREPAAIPDERRARAVEPAVAPEPAPRPVAPQPRPAPQPSAAPQPRPAAETSLTVNPPASAPVIQPTAAPAATPTQTVSAPAPRPTVAPPVPAPTPQAFERQVSTVDRPAPQPVIDAPLSSARPAPVPTPAGSRFADFAAKLAPNRTVPPAAPLASAATVPPKPVVPTAAPTVRVEPPAHVPVPANQQGAARDLDDELLAELDATLDSGLLDTGPELPASVEDEMSKLLGQLSRPPRN